MGKPKPLTPKRQRQANIILSYIKNNGTLWTHEQAEEVASLLEFKNAGSLRNAFQHIRLAGINLPEIRFISEAEKARKLKASQGTLDRCCPRCAKRKMSIRLTWSNRAKVAYCLRCGWYDGWGLTLCSGM